MSGFSSFYGGRMGASFIIVKRFDAVDLPQTTYKAKYLAVTTDGKYFVYNNGFIERTSDNYTDYIWKIQQMDGSTVDTKTDPAGTGPTSQQVLGIVYAEGMRQCFEQGGDTTDIVNYGEYVIIDTPLKNDPDNGKVYRRGMNYDYNADTNPLAGAEYIGQIVGPQGETPEIEIDHYEDIIEEYGDAANKREYDEINQDLVPGSYEENGNRYFNDTIKYTFATMKDSYGNVQGCIIGFKLPTLVQDFEASSMSPYEQRAIDPTTGKYYNYDLISEDPSQYINNKWQHPFYQKWQIKIPHGYHGVNSTNLEIIHSKTMPKGFKSNDFAGTAVYTDEACTVPYMSGGNPLVFTTSVDILRDVYYDADESVKYAMVFFDNQYLYVKKEDCYMDIVRYRETNFDNLETGEVTYIEVGDYNDIRRITLSEDGTLTVFYNAISEPKELEQVLRWIDTVDSNGITIDNDGTVKVYYNTLHDDGSGHMVHDFQSYPNVLDWITQVTLTQNGNFDVLFNNNTIQDGHYHTVLNWIDYITLDADGTIKFYFNSDHTTPAYTFNKYVKVLSDVDIETKASGSTYEGTGDQKVHITYNTGDEDIIGNPLNYIIETVISVPNSSYPNVPYQHLLVYYSDPTLRASMSSKWVTYPSTKIIDGYDSEDNPIYHVWTEWVDLGNVRGAPGGIHILKDVPNMNDLKDRTTGEWIPPEKIEDSSGTVLNPDAAGWCVTYTPAGSTSSQILCYDYDDEVWYSIGTIDAGAVDPQYVIDKSTPTSSQVPAPGDATYLKAHGFWFATETGYYAY